MNYFIQRSPECEPDRRHYKISETEVVAGWCREFLRVLSHHKQACTHRPFGWEFNTRLKSIGNISRRVTTEQLRIRCQCLALADTRF